MDPAITPPRDDPTALTPDGAERAIDVPTALATGIASSFPLPSDPGAARATTLAVREAFLRANPRLGANCTGMTGTDLARLFALYDDECFRGFLTRRLTANGCAAPIFGFSARLTAAAGQTKKLTWDAASAGGGVVRRTAYRIDVSIPLLMESFRGPAHREIDVCGLACADMLDALQRILEHELIHLLEFVGDGRTDCRAPNFHFFASRVFGHTVTRHGLITPRERAFVELGIRAGDRVAFEHLGVRQVGRVERIRQRVTVLVETPCPSGSGDVHCVKFSVPLSLLTKADG